MLPEISV
jgi:large subunit ribosomal protein L23Ae